MALETVLKPSKSWFLATFQSVALPIFQLETRFATLQSLSFPMRVKTSLSELNCGRESLKSGQKMGFSGYEHDFGGRFMPEKSV